MSERHKVRIEATPEGRGTLLYLDDQPLKGVVSYSLTGSAEITRLTFVMLAERVEVEGEVEHPVIELIPNPPTR